MAIVAGIQTIGWLIGGAVMVATPPVSAPAPAPLVNRSQAETAGLTLYWQRTAPLNADEQLLRIHRLEENLYLITRQGRVVTLDAATGVFRWAASLVEPDIRILGPSHSPDLAYFATGPWIQAFDRTNGQQEMRWESTVTACSPVASDGQSLFFGTIEGRVLNLRLPDLLMLWQFGTSGMTTAKPILQGPNLVAVSQTGRIYAALKKDKTRVWEAETTGPVQADPAVYGNHLYVASMDQSLWCFDMATGRTLWRTRTAIPLSLPPKATAKHVYLPASERGVYSINAENGNIEWIREDAADFLAEHENMVWLLSMRGSLLGCHKLSGEIRHEIETLGYLYVSNEDDDGIWLGVASGQVVCVRPQGAGFLKYRAARVAAARITPATTRPATEPLEEGFVPAPPPRPPVDYLRRSDTIPPVGGSTQAPAAAPESGQ